MKKIKDPLSLSVYAFSNIIIVFASISIIFPALLVRLSSGSSISTIDPFELGVFALPLLVSNILFFTLYFFIKKSSKNFGNTLQKIVNFDISQKIGLLTILSIILIYAALNYNEIFLPNPWPDHAVVMAQYDMWLSDTPQENIAQYHTKMFFIHISKLIFDNFNTIPFFASLFLIFLTYLFTVKISSKQIAGVVAALVLVQSGIFTIFDTTSTYANFWIVFYLLSLYLIEKSWRLSPLSYLVSIFAKPITLSFLPFSIFYILRSSISKQKKIFSLISYLIIGISVFVALFLLFPKSDLLSDTTLIFHFPKFISGFSILPYQLRFDFLILMSLIPINFLLYKKSVAGNKYSQSLQILISGIILSGPMLTGFLNFQTNPYRLVPLAVFFAVSFGFLFGKITCRKQKLE